MTHDTEIDPRLRALLDTAREAGPGDRIELRDPLAAFGVEALEPMAQWLTEPRLGAFAVRVLERIAREPADRSMVVRVLADGRTSAATPSIAADITDILMRLGAPVTLHRTGARATVERTGTPGRAERAYWAMHTWERSQRGAGQRAYVWAEIQSGRLRQGWGWDQSQDLRRIQARLDAGLDLTGWEADAWRARRMLTSRPDAIHVDDVVIAVGVPERDLFVGCRVTGPYDFDPNAEIGDYGHVLPIEVVIRPTDRAVRAIGEPLHFALNNRTRLWRIDGVGGEIEGLVAAVGPSRANSGCWS